MKLRTKAWRSLVLLFVLIGAIWGVIVWRSFEPNLGLDLQGGISIALSPVEGSEVAPGALEKATDIIRERVDALGVAEPDITQQGDDTIIVQIAGIRAEEQDRAFELIGSTAQLSFRPVIGRPVPCPKGQGDGAELCYVPPGSGSEPTYEPLEQVPTCADRATYPRDDAEQILVSCMETGEGTFQRLVLGPAALTGDLVTDADAVPPSAQNLEWFVSLDLNKEGAQKFQQVTGQLACNRGRGGDQLAIVLDSAVRSAPTMGEGVECNKGIPDGNAQITGGFTEDDSKDLALVLRYGALPVELESVSTSTVSPTLGRESLRNGLIASAIGIAIVFLYVLLFYRLLGPVIWLGILIHAVITFGVIILLGEAAGFALSLAGIAGLIVSLGIAADSFIVYFERIRDEVASGKPVRSSVERAWPSARRTIIAADLVTALAAIVLYLLAVGSVRGFALMLGLSTLLDLIVSFVFMHPIVYLIGQSKRMRNARSFGVTPEARTV